MRTTTGSLLSLLLAASSGCAGLVSTTQPPGYGAVAYAPGSQDWRLRWQAADPQRARQRALADCAAADCQVLLEFGPGQCGTLALGSKVVGVGTGDTPAAAEAAALADCRRQGTDCRVAAAECNR